MKSGQSALLFSLQTPGVGGCWSGGVEAAAEG